MVLVDLFTVEGQMDLEVATVVRGVTDLGEAKVAEGAKAAEEAKVAGEVKIARAVEEEVHHGIGQQRKEAR